ncbi:MAG: DegT/DnrJ/EryC1/StrS family aminotransferase [Candidatus Margulisiibacteriota bacterium]|jgi:perosamine synthetase
MIPISEPSITQKEIDYVNEAMKSGWVSSLGSYIDNFEKKFAEFCNTKYAVSVSNGTAALHLALLALNISENDEVIIPNLTFIATANAVSYVKAKIKLVDIEETTLCIDPEKIEKAITKNTKAIIPVHLYGHPSNMPKIMEIAKKYNLAVIEDAAEAHGAKINKKMVGSFGDLGIFSFYGNKIMTTGEGGIITTNNETLYNKIKFLKDHGMSKDKRYFHTQIAYNYRMTNLQAALGLAQLERIKELLARKKKIYELYSDNLKDIPKIRLNFTANWAINVYWMVCLEYENWNETSRDQFIFKLKNNGIDSRPYFYPINYMPMYKDIPADTPIANKIFQKGINLPSSFNLTDKEIIFICKTIRKLLDS